MKLTYIYHSGFAIEDGNVSLLVDYYKDTSGNTTQGYVHDELLKRPGKLYILSSHSHADHFNAEILTWKKQRPDIQYIFSEDIRTTQGAETQGAVFLKKGEEWNDGILKIKAFGSTDIGISFLIGWGEKQIFHAGDLNNWHWKEESTPEESKEYENNFLKELDILAKETKCVDVAMLPVDPRLGKEYMRGAEQFVDRIATGLFVPMHFWEKYDKANDFKAYAEGKGCRFAAWHQPGDQIVF